LIDTGENGEAILQKGDTFTIVQVTRKTRVRLDYKALHQLTNFYGKLPRFLPIQGGVPVPTLPIDVFDIEEGGIIGNYSEPVAINTLLGYAYIDGTVPTQFYAASLAGNGRPSRAVPRAKTTHKVLWFQKEGKGEIKPKPKVLKQVLDAGRGDKIPPDNTVRALFDAAQDEIMAQADAARLLTPEDMEEEPVTGFPEPNFDKVQPGAMGDGTDFFGSLYKQEQVQEQNNQVNIETGKPKTNTFANELLNNPQQAIEGLAQILNVNLPNDLTPQQIALLQQLAQNAPGGLSLSNLLNILGTGGLSDIVPELTPPFTTPF
jgi:hypothetical protein